MWSRGHLDPFLKIKAADDRQDQHLAAVVEEQPVPGLERHALT